MTNIDALKLSMVMLHQFELGNTECLCGEPLANRKQFAKHLLAKLSEVEVEHAVDAEQAEEAPSFTTASTGAPYEEIYVVITGSTKRVYDKMSSAKTRVTTMVNQNQEHAAFTDSVELWSISQSGWHLIFAAAAGESYETIPWKNAIRSNKIRKINLEEERQLRDEAAARLEYEKLKDRFGS